MKLTTYSENSHGVGHHSITCVRTEERNGFYFFPKLRVRRGTIFEVMGLQREKFIISLLKMAPNSQLSEGTIFQAHLDLGLS